MTRRYRNGTAAVALRCTRLLAAKQAASGGGDHTDWAITC